jgi:hypothetical protein
MARLLDSQAVMEAIACPPPAQQILAQLHITMATRLVFGVAGAMEESAELTKRERNILEELFPPLLGWVNECT